MRMFTTGLSIDAVKIKLVLSMMSQSLVRAIQKVSKAEPNIQRNNEREQRAFDAYKKISGKDCLAFTRKSAQEMADMAVRIAMVEWQKKNPCPPGYFDAIAEVKK